MMFSKAVIPSAKTAIPQSGQHSLVSQAATKQMSTTTCSNFSSQASEEQRSGPHDGMHEVGACFTARPLAGLKPVLRLPVETTDHGVVGQF